MATISILIIPLLMLLFLAVPVLIGIYVYKDAKRRCMNAPLWTLIAVLAPGFVGLIIYLIVRADFSETKCVSCGNNVKKSFAVCPYCGSALKERCKSCGHILESGWRKCPECGEEIPDYQRKTEVRGESDKGLKAILAVVIVIPVIVCLLMVSAISIFRVSSGSGYSSMFMEDVLMSDVQDDVVGQWMKDCDANGPGIYVLKSVKEDIRYEDEYNTKMYIYRNDGIYNVEHIDSDMGGFFKDASAEFYFSEYDVTGNEVRDYTLSYFEYTGRNECSPVFSDGEMELEGKIKTIDSIEEPLETSAENYIYADVYVSEKLEQVYSVGWELYNGDKIVLGEGSAVADDTDMAGEAVDFMYTCSVEDEVTDMIIIAYDEEGDGIFISEPYSIEEIHEWSVKMDSDENGNIVIKAEPF